jgi:hypothetical protein
MTEKHWTEEELIAHLYGIGPEDGHISNCAECAHRLQTMQSGRIECDSVYPEADQVSFEFLAAQRRKIYQRMAEPLGREWRRRFAPALAASLVLVGGLFLYEEQRPAQSPAVVKASDTQLVEDVGRVAMNPEPPPVAPLRALFEE